MSMKQHKLLANVNRALIFVLSLTGLLMDGYQHADLPVTVALLAWLWLVACTRMEARILGWSQGDHARAPRYRNARTRAAEAT